MPFHLLPAYSPFQASGDFFTPFDPAAQARTADARSLAARTRRSRLAHELLMRGQADESEDDIALLERALSGRGVANIFGQPRDDQDARLQRIVQQDMDGRQRGENMVWSDPQKLRYNSAMADYQGQLIQNDLQPRLFGLNQQKFEEQRNQNFYNILNQEELRRQGDERLEGTEKNTEKNREAKLALGKATLDQRDRHFRERAAASQKEKQSKQTAHQIFQSAARAVDNGALPPADIQRLFGDRLEPNQLEMLEGYGRVQAERTAERNAELEQLADKYNAQLQSSIDLEQPWAITKRFGAKPPPIDKLADPFIKEISKDRRAQGSLYLDKTQGKFVPRLLPTGGAGATTGPASGSPGGAPAAPQAMRPPPEEGETRRDPRTGDVYALRGGQPILISGPSRLAPPPPARPPGTTITPPEQDQEFKKWLSDQGLKTWEKLNAPEARENTVEDFDRQIRETEEAILKLQFQSALGPAERTATGNAIDENTGQEIPRRPGQSLADYEYEVARQRLGMNTIRRVTQQPRSLRRG